MVLLIVMHAKPLQMQLEYFPFCKNQLIYLLKEETTLFYQENILFDQ